LSSRPSEQGTQALKLLERAGGIKELELDRNIETGDEAGPGAVHVPGETRRARRMCYGCRWVLIVK